MLPISHHLAEVQNQVRQAALNAGRQPGEVTLIAVSKTKPMPDILEAWQAGQVDFGENRPQELREKQPQLPQARWHMIGTLQRNKVKYLLPWVHLIHSVDSESLLAEINRLAGQHQQTARCLLQLNISEEDAKSGLDEAATRQLLRSLEQYPWVSIHGLMGMAAFTDDQALIRSQFRRLREARDWLREENYPRVSLDELSMGMSGDFAIAIEEGATMVRIGSAIFGGRG